MKYKIYIICNKLNNKVYIGYTSREIDKRFSEHCNLHIKQHLHLAIAKFGIDNFSIQLIESFNNKESALEAERFWIGFFRSWDPKFGYNFTLGGENTPVKLPSSINQQKTSFIINRDAGLCKNVKLTRKKVLEIKRMILSKEKSYTQISKDFNISTTVVCEIARNKKWKDVLKDTPIIETPKDNWSMPGSKNGNAKLDEATVLKMRAEYISVKNYAELARKYGISESQVARIIKRESFKNV